MTDPRLKGKVKKKRPKRLKNIVDADYTILDIENDETLNRPNVIPWVVFGGLLGYSILILGQLGALLAFALSAGWIVREVWK